MNIEQAQKHALNWFRNRGMNPKVNGDNLIIQVQEYEVEVSTDEVFYRAELWEEEKESWEEELPNQ